MSQIGKKEILIPEKVSVTLDSNIVTVKGPLGELSYNSVDGITISINENIIRICDKFFYKNMV